MERNGSQSRGLEVTASSEIFRGVAKMADIVPNREIEDPLGLLESLVDVRVFETPNFYVYSCNMPDTKLWGEDLKRLLTIARPGKREYKQAIRDIWADWELTELQSDNPYTDQLKTLHENGLGYLWREFNDFHRAKLKNALLSMSLSDSVEFVEKLPGYYLNGLVLHQDHLVQNCLPYLERAAKYHNRFMNFLTNNPQLVGGWFEEAVSEVATMRLSPESLYKLLESLSEESKLKLARNIFLAEIVPIRFTEVDFISGHEIRNNYSGVPCIQRYLGQNCFEVEFPPSKVFYEWDGNSWKPYKSEITQPHEVALSPWLVWTKSKNSNLRFYQLGKIPNWLEDMPSENVDSLVGLLVVAALSPDQRKKMPEQLGLPGVKREQMMREAQIPLLVSIMRDGLVQSPVLVAIERFSGTENNLVDRTLRNLGDFGQNGHEKLSSSGATHKAT